ncbi:hypothetical protein ACFWUP_30295 [Nocardia sp. NPDC058658]|uniref:hypothetical protein n=1 Tax=Nocardia sp. NPDC058658 TaxID=3346580 RepID=UPI003647969B
MPDFRNNARTDGKPVDTVRDRVQRARDRIRARRAEQRLRDAAIVAAVKTFATARAAVTERETHRDTAINELQQRITRLRESAATDIADLRAQQGAAVAQMKAHGQSDDEIAELLDLTPRQTRQLLTHATGSAVGATKHPPQPSSVDASSSQRPAIELC